MLIRSFILKLATLNNKFRLLLQDLIKKLLRRPVTRRLGSTTGASEIKSHCFFKDVDWDDVYNKSLKPPFVPNVNSQEDVSNFDSRFTSTVISRESADESNDQPSIKCIVSKADEVDGADPKMLFSDFDYVSPQMMEDHLEDKVMSIQDLRIRGFGNP